MNFAMAPRIILPRPLVTAETRMGDIIADSETAYVVVVEADRKQAPCDCVLIGVSKELPRRVGEPDEDGFYYTFQEAPVGGIVNVTSATESVELCIDGPEYCDGQWGHALFAAFSTLKKATEWCNQLDLTPRQHHGHGLPQHVTFWWH